VLLRRPSPCGINCMQFDRETKVTLLAKMRAIVQREPGGTHVLSVETTDLPVPRPTELLVKVIAAGVNPTDWKTRQRGRFAGGATPPFILGFDVSGIVVALGDGVTRFAVGDEVFGLLRYPQPAGGYAEYVAAPSRQLAWKPPHLTHVEAAALPLAGTTAWQALEDVAKVASGDRVLVHAAAGGVGHLAGQIAHAKGAVVYGTARTEKHERLKGLGFDVLIDYRLPAPADLGGFDAILDPLGGQVMIDSLELLKPDGSLVAILPVAPDLRETLESRGERRVRRMVVEPDRIAIEGLAALAADNRLRPVIDSVFPLERAGEAHARGESGRAFGKIVLHVDKAVA